MSQEQVMRQEQVYLKGFNKVENSVLFPDDASADTILDTSKTLNLATVKSWIKIDIDGGYFFTDTETQITDYGMSYKINDGNYIDGNFSGGAFRFTDTYLSTYKNNNLYLFSYYMLYSIYKYENNNYIKVEELKYLVNEEKNNRPANWNYNNLAGTYYIPYNIENFVYDEDAQNVDPRHILGIWSTKVSFNDSPWLSDSETGSDNITSNYATLHLKSIHSFNFWQEENEPNTGGGGEG